MRRFIILIFSFLFLRVQSPILIRIFFIGIIFISFIFIYGINLLVYYLFIIVILRGIIVIYIYFCSLTNNEIYIFEGSSFLLFVSTFIFTYIICLENLLEDHRVLFKHFFYIDNWYAMIVLLVLLLFVMFVVSDLLSSFINSLRRKI